MRARTIAISAFALGNMMLPLIVSAQTAGGIFNVLNIATRILNILVGLFILAAVVLFFYGLVRYMISLGGEKKGEALQLMVWGIVALFVMVSIWGLVGILQGTLGVSSNTPVPLPQGIQPRGL